MEATATETDHALEEMRAAIESCLSSRRIGTHLMTGTIEGPSGQATGDPGFVFAVLMRRAII